MNGKPRIRVLVAEDSPTQRELLVAILRADPEIELVGQAVDGVEAVELAAKLRPTVITMDVAMPRLGGLEATKRIMTESPTAIVISSNLDTQVIRAAMRAIDAGALAVLHKPPGPSSPRFEEAAHSFVRDVKLYARVSVVGHHGRSAPRLEPVAATLPARPQLVAIATSTGGPPALRRILHQLPADFGAPILVVQHIAPEFVGGLASWLDDAVALRVKVAQDGEALRPGVVLLAPDDRHLCLADRHTVRLDASPPVNGFRPAATAMFTSVAHQLGSSAVGVVLTGMGSDGLAGLELLRASGGRVIAQEEHGCVVFGMPRAAIDAGLATEVLDLDGIAACLREAVARLAT